MMDASWLGLGSVFVFVDGLGFCEESGTLWDADLDVCVVANLLIFNSK